MNSTILQRMRAAKLRPTIARIGVLQIIEAVEPGRICAEDIFRKMLLRGTRVSIGTVYRAVHEFERAGLLLCEWDRTRKAYYRVKSPDFDAHKVRLMCQSCGRCIALTDAVLHERLEQLALLQGIRISNHGVTIAVDCASCADRHSDSAAPLMLARDHTLAAPSRCGRAMAAG